jgi:hypothetical protein
MPRYRRPEDFLGSFFFGSLETQIIKHLRDIANKIAEDAKNNVSMKKTYKGNDLPSEIADAISVGEVENTGKGTYSISINVDLTKAPMAAAYEYGSGEWATRGEKGTYPITPKGNYPLHFLWFYPSRTGKKIKSEPNPEEVWFESVKHPGVEAVPYLKPAIDDNVKAVTDGVIAALRTAIRNTTVKVVIIEPEK